VDYDACYVGDVNGVECFVSVHHGPEVFMLTIDSLLCVSLYVVST